MKTQVKLLLVEVVVLAVFATLGVAIMGMDRSETFVKGTSHLQSTAEKAAVQEIRQAAIQAGPLE